MPRVGLRRLLACMLAAGLYVAGRAAAQAVPEYELKAAFIYNFALFVDWPAEARKGDTFHLCVAGRGPMESALDALQGKPVKSQRLIVRRIGGAQDPSDCHMLYIAPAEEMHLTRLLELAEGRPILSVGDAEGFSQRGVMINLSMRQNRLIFDINLNSTRRAGLAMSSRLLNLANSVIEP